MVSFHCPHPAVYSPFGLSDTVSAAGNPYRFAGRRLDPETGLYYYRHRYYSLGLGIFLEPDPLGHGIDNWNLYAYVLNSPINWVDPFGLLKDPYKYDFIKAMEELHEGKQPPPADWEEIYEALQNAPSEMKEDFVDPILQNPEAMYYIEAALDAGAQEAAVLLAARFIHPVLGIALAMINSPTIFIDIPARELK